MIKNWVAPFLVFLAAWNLYGTPKSNAGSGQLRISIEQINHAQSQIDQPEFQITFENIGPDDMVINLGTMLANARNQLPNKVRLFLKTDGQPVKELQFCDERYPYVAGRIDPYVVPLRSGSIQRS